MLKEKNRTALSTHLEKYQVVDAKQITFTRRVSKELYI
jgi:hypothetical protein